MSSNDNTLRDEGFGDENPDDAAVPNDSSTGAGAEGGTGSATTSDNDNPTPNEAEASTTGNDNGRRAPSALHNRLLHQQRSNILLQVLFHHMLNSRRRREEEEALAVNPPPLPDRDMPILSHDQAVAENAMCRFCFEGSVAVAEAAEQQQQLLDNSSSNNSQSSSSNALVAPCNCAGGSRWVHLECLRQWQRLQARSLSQSNLGGTGDPNAATTTYTATGYICNVCNSPYLSRPPPIRSVRRNVLKRGTLLVSKPNAVGRTFQQTVVLLLSDVGSGNSHGAFGLIVNQELTTPPTQRNTTNPVLLPPPPQLPQSSSSDGETASLENNDNSIPSINNSISSQHNNNTVIEWRRGGPVCGGRLGVVHYTILHTYPTPNMMVDGFDPDDVLDVDIDEEYYDENDPDDEAATVEEDDYDVEAAEAEDYQSAPEDEITTAAAVGDGNTTHSEDDDDEEDDDDLPESNSCAPLSLPVFDVAPNSPRLQFIATPDSAVPCTFSEDSLGHTVQRLVVHGNHAVEGTEQNNNAASEVESATATPTTNPNSNTTNNDAEESNTTTHAPHKVIVFSGYCKWRAGQLEREIQREVWDVCIDATPEDVLRHHDSGFWEEISESNRLLSWQRLVEDEGAGVAEE